MKNMETIKYLGDYLCGEGLAESVTTTVSRRRGLVIKAISEIRSVVDDIRSNLTGGLATGLIMWEMAVVPMLLYNSESWQEMPKKTLEDLENLQVHFLKFLK